MQYSSSTPDSMDRFSSQGFSLDKNWDNMSGDEVKDGAARSSWITVDSKVTDSDTWPLSATSPGHSDNDDDSRSQSPGGLVMQGDRETKGTYFLTTDDNSTTGADHWGAQNSSNEMVGSNWKTDTAIDDSEEEVANIMTGAYYNQHLPGGRKNSSRDGMYEWGGNSDEISDMNRSHMTSTISNQSSLNRPGIEPHTSTMFSPSDACNGHTNHGSTGSQEELGYKGSNMYSSDIPRGAETPNRCSSRSSGGVVTPTGKQESGGRASVGSTSSANSVSSNSSWNSDGKGGNKGSSNRSSSPRKLTRFELLSWDVVLNE